MLNTKDYLEELVRLQKQFVYESDSLRKSIISDRLDEIEAALKKIEGQVK